MTPGTLEKFPPTPIDSAATDFAEPPRPGHHGTHGKWLLPAITAIGVVYGDIGTSPLYAFQVAIGTAGENVSRADVLGIVSLIFWSIILVVAVKYVTVVMRADNEGEGGILALLSLVSGGRQFDRRGLPILVALGIIGAAFIYGDGIITPAISVLSALEGLEVAAPSVDHFVLPLTLIILIGLFAVQFRGTGDIGKVFGPVMVFWFISIAALGLVAIIRNPGVLVAVNPVFALHMLAGGGARVLAIVGTAFLALTGAEALYADMGHVGAMPIRRAWFGLVLPALALNYFGQGALVLSHPEAAKNPFYEMAPKIVSLPLVLLASAATVIASQALISGAFSLTQQAIQMRLLPRMMIRSTSGRHQGQIYIGAVNWLLMIGSIAVVIGFKSSSNLAAAYGIAVSGTMLVTSILLFNVVRRRWNWPPVFAWLLIGGFTIVDLFFLSANAIKFIEGGWFPLIVGAVLAFLMLIWRSGTIEVQRRLEEMTSSLDHFLETLDKRVIARIPGCAVFVTRAEKHASPVLVQQVEHNRVLHENVILLTIEPQSRPVVHARERLEITSLGNGFYRVIAKVGFLQTPDLPMYVRGCARLGLECAKDEVHYFVGYEHVVRRPRKSHFPIVLWHVFSVMSKIAVRMTDFTRVPEENVFEIGIKVMI